VPGEHVINRSPEAVPVPGGEATPPVTGQPAGGPAPPVAGLYGKLPSRGDFVERRLSDAFVDRWDVFLDEGLRAAAGVLGERFAERYLVAPFWRFALGAGVAGDFTVVGVFAPSVDKVGRYFPLTVAAELAPGVGAAAGIAAAEAWLAQAEALIYDALGPEAGFEALDEGVAALPVAEPPAAAEAPDGGRMISSPLLAQGLVGVLPPAAVPVIFWTLGSVDLPPRLITFGGLPPAARFAALLDGAWEGVGT